MYNNIGGEFVQDNINFISIEYSGHGIRYTEKLGYLLKEIAEHVYKIMKDYELKLAYCIWGYSMWCLLSYKL